MRQQPPPGRPDAAPDATRDAAPAAAPGDWSACIAAIAARGDRAAFAALFGHFAPRLKTWFLQSGRLPAAQAEDLAQETMLAVWHKAALFDPGRAAAATWIFAIGRNLLTDRRRRERVAGAAALALTRLPLPEAEPRPDAAVERDAEARRLRGALRSLPPDQREVLHLAYFAENSHGAIAAALGLPLGTVKGRLRVALARLRLALAGEAGPPA